MSKWDNLWKLSKQHKWSLRPAVKMYTEIYVLPNVAYTYILSISFLRTLPMFLHTLVYWLGFSINTSKPRFIALWFMALRRHCVFYKLKVCGNPASSQSVNIIFPTSFAHFMCLCHILVILSIFQTFSLLLYLLWWPVIRDLWCHHPNCLGAPWAVPI